MRDSLTWIRRHRTALTFVLFYTGWAGLLKLGLLEYVSDTWLQIALVLPLGFATLLIRSDVDRLTVLFEFAVIGLTIGLIVELVWNVSNRGRYVILALLLLHSVCFTAFAVWLVAAMD